MDRCLASSCVSRLVWCVLSAEDKVGAQRGISEAGGRTEQTLKQPQFSLLQLLYFI